MTEMSSVELPTELVTVSRKTSVVRELTFGAVNVAFAVAALVSVVAGPETWDHAKVRGPSQARKFQQ